MHHLIENNTSFEAIVRIANILHNIKTHWRGNGCICFCRSRITLDHGQSNHSFQDYIPINYEHLYKSALKFSNTEESLVLLQNMESDHKCDKDHRQYLIDKLECVPCYKLIIALESRHTFNEFVTMNALHLNHNFIKRIFLLKTKKQLLKIVKNIALDNNLIIFGSAVLAKFSGIMANDIDITGEKQHYVKFIKQLEIYFEIIKKESEESEEYFKYPINIIKSQIKCDELILDIDYVESTVFKELKHDFRASSFIMKKNNKNTNTLILRINQKTNIDNVEKYIYDAIQETRDKILTFCPQDTCTIKSLYTCTKIVQRSFTKMAQGWNLPSGIIIPSIEYIKYGPSFNKTFLNKTFQYISYSYTRQQFMQLCAQHLLCNFDPINNSNDQMPNVIWNIIMDYFDASCFVDDSNGSLCKCSEQNMQTQDLARDFMFVHPCCERTHCIPCALYDLKTNRLNVLNNELGHIHYVCNRCSLEIKNGNYNIKHLRKYNHII